MPNLAMKQNYSFVYNAKEEVKNKPKICKITPLNKETPKTENQQLLEQLEVVIEEVIKLYYEMELSILSDGIIPEELYTRLEGLKELNSIYKKSLNLPDSEKINLPQSFIEEYSNLFNRTSYVIERVKDQLEHLEHNFTNDLFIKEAKKRLGMLIALNLHYKKTLSEHAS